MRQTVRLLAGVASGVGVAFALAAPAQAQQSFTLGYSTGFLQDPFQVIQADRVMTEGKKAGLKRCRSPTRPTTLASRSPTSTT